MMYATNDCFCFSCCWEDCLEADTDFVEAQKYYWHVEQHAEVLRPLPGSKQTEPYQCQWSQCQSLFGSVSKLKEHLRTHTLVGARMQGLWMLEQCQCVFLGKSLRMPRVWRPLWIQIKIFWPLYPSECGWPKQIFLRLLQTWLLQRENVAGSYEVRLASTDLRAQLSESLHL